MDKGINPRSARAVCSRIVLGGLCVVASGLAVGCQTYTPQPLDFAAHAERVRDRGLGGESVGRFAARFEASGSDAPARFDMSDGVSLAEGEALALFYNPDLRLIRLEAGVARATEETAGLWEDPEFGFDGAEILSPAGVFEYGLTLGLTLPISGRLGVEKARARAALDEALARVVDAEWNTRSRVRSAWAAWTVAAERAVILAGAVGDVERVASVTDRLEAAGELSRVEARLIRAELVDMRGQRIEADRQAETARLALLGLMGLAPDAMVTLQAGLPSGRSPGVVERVERLITSSTALAVERAAYRVAEESLRLEIREQYPDVSFGTGYGSEDGDDRLLLGLSVKLPVFNANRGGVAEARAQRELALARAQTAYERLAQSLARAKTERDAAVRMRMALESELVPMLDEQAVEVDRLTGLGEVDTLLLLETVTRRVSAKVRLLELRLAESLAQAEIDRLLGPGVVSATALTGAAQSEQAQTSRTGPAGEGVADGKGAGQ